MKKNKNLQNDPRLTAYALGELSPSEAAKLERQLAQSAPAQAALADIRQTADRLTASLATEPALALSPAQHAAITAAAASAPRSAHAAQASAPAPISTLTLLWFTTKALAAAAALLLAVSFPWQRSDQADSAEQRRRATAHGLLVDAHEHLVARRFDLAAGALEQIRLIDPQNDYAARLDDTLQALVRLNDTSISGNGFAIGHRFGGGDVVASLSEVTLGVSGGVKPDSGLPTDSVVGGASATPLFALGGQSLLYRSTWRDRPMPPTPGRPMHYGFDSGGLGGAAQDVLSVQGAFPGEPTVGFVVKPTAETHGASTPPLYLMVMTGNEPARGSSGGETNSVLLGYDLRRVSEIQQLLEGFDQRTGSVTEFAFSPPYTDHAQPQQYSPVVHNPFLWTDENPLSTFSIDVDTASYANVRRFLNDGRRPPAGAVRIEEMVNYFTYDYAPPGDELTLGTPSGSERAACATAVSAVSSDGRDAGDDQAALTTDDIDEYDLDGYAEHFGVDDSEAIADDNDEAGEDTADTAVALSETGNMPNPHPFAVHTEIADCPWVPAHRLLRIGLKGREIDPADRPAANIVLLLDVSGSMKEEDRLPMLQIALQLLVEQLGRDDSLAIVTYAGDARVVLPATRGDAHYALLAAIDSLHAEGSTNGGAGLELAYQIASENFVEGGENRVILATDGDFNVGTTDEHPLVQLVRAQSAGGIFLTVIGVGDGNFQDAKLEMLADRGNGHYVYLDTLDEAYRVLYEQAGGLFTIAKDVKIQVEFNPIVVQAYRLLGYENRMLAAADFNDDAKDAGEIGGGHTVTALYEIVPVGIDPPRWDEQAAEEAEIFGDSGDGHGSLAEGTPHRAVAHADDHRAVAHAEALRPDPRALAAQDTLRGLILDPRVDPLEYYSAVKVVLAAAAEHDETATIKLRYKLPQAAESTLVQHVVIDAGRPLEAASNDYRFAAAVASFAMLLRDTPELKGWTFDDVLNLAQTALGPDEDGARREFLELCRAARALSGD